MPELRTALDQIASGYFCPNDPHQFAGFVDNLLNHDRFKVCADFEAYLQCQERVSEAFKVSINYSLRYLFIVGLPMYSNNARFLTNLFQFALH